MMKAVSKNTNFRFSPVRLVSYRLLADDGGLCTFEILNRSTLSDQVGLSECLSMLGLNYRLR